MYIGEMHYQEKNEGRVLLLVFELWTLHSKMEADLNVSLQLIIQKGLEE